MPFSAQKLFPLKYSVLWELSFEHFSNCRLSTFFVESALFDVLSNPDVMLCSCPPKTTCQSCCGISAGVFCTCYSRRDAATLDFWRWWFSMGYKTQRGNATKKSLRFHAISKILSDYQWVTKHSVAASRRRSHWCFVKETLPPPCPSSIATVAFV